MIIAARDATEPAPITTNSGTLSCFACMPRELVNNTGASSARTEAQKHREVYCTRAHRVAAGLVGLHAEDRCEQNCQQQPEMNADRVRQPAVATSSARGSADG